MTREEIALQIFVAVYGNRENTVVTLDKAKQVAEAYNAIVKTIDPFLGRDQ